MLAAAALALWLLYALRMAVAPFLVALALTYVLEPLVTRLQQTGLRRVWSILLVYVAVGAVAATVVVVLIPQFLRELGDLAAQIPKYVAILARFAGQWRRRYDAIPLPDSVRNALDDGINDLEAQLQQALRQLVESMFATATVLWILVPAPFIAFYLLKDTAQFRATFLGLLPGRDRMRWLSLLRQCDQVLAGFVRGQLLIAAVVGSAAGLAFWALGLPFPLLLGVLTGIGEFVPYFGPILAAVPALLLALEQSAATALKVVLLLLLINQLEQALLVPYVLGERVGLHPLLVVFALLVGGQFWGVVGMVLAVPVAGFARVFWCFVQESRQAGAGRGGSKPEPSTSGVE